MGAVAEINFGVSRGKTGGQSLFTPAFAGQGLQGVFDVFARAQGVDREVRTGTKVVPQTGPADRQPILPFGLGIGHLIFRKKGLLADVFEREGLLIDDLLAQGDLPLFQGHVRGSSQRRETFGVG